MIVAVTGTFCEAARANSVPIPGVGWADWSGPTFREAD
jgi:hypothetical protein